ncbi:MAG: ligase-associated DNA damage response exonuclease [Saprospiraceae bacterium]|nr:ligase-associated DNA damage response exonuclease [Saprospiraceae bacterium]
MWFGWYSAIMGLSSLLEFTEKGIYVPKGDFYIDPIKKVKQAVITHGHSDHARSGNIKYLCTDLTKPVLKLRLGSKINVQSLAFGESFFINGVKLSFHPAGHLPGSAQVRVEYKGHIAVISGDYKLEKDGLAEAFEPVFCHEFVTESTFALPIYQWQAQEKIIADIFTWWQQNQSEKKASIISAYPLGKSQRLISALYKYSPYITCHPSIENTNIALRNAGVDIPILDDLFSITKNESHRYLVLTPTIISQGLWLQNFPHYELADASGWMATKQGRKRSTAHRHFTLSDHADWPSLNQAVLASQAETVFVTHGFSDDFARHLKEQKINAQSIDHFFTRERIEQE